MLVARRLLWLPLCCAFAAPLGSCDGPTSDWPSRGTDDKPGSGESDGTPQAPASFADAGLVVAERDAGGGSPVGDASPCSSDSDSAADAPGSDSGSLVQGDSGAEGRDGGPPAPLDSDAGATCP